MKKKIKYYFYNFSKLKWNLIKDFFLVEDVKIFHINSLEDASKNKLDQNSIVFFWGKKIDSSLNKYALENNIEINYIEDGFIRSFGLGSSLSKPLSIVRDAKGIYFDPTQQSELENILSNYNFDKNIKLKAKRIIDLVKELKISKYNHQFEKKIIINNTKDQSIILIPGQVDDDMSVKFGAPGMSNMKLIQQVREKRPNDFLIYKPHPDVLSGNRIGNLSDNEVLSYVNLIVKDIDIDTMINLSDEVHTMTSLSGFDALVRGKDVYTYGLPFYAGWGLTNDEKVCKRRTRTLDLYELAAAAYILYPIYLNPFTKKLTSVEDVIDIIVKEKDKFKKNTIFRNSKKFLGYFLPKLRNFIKSVRGL